jgi:hypothetical protein
MYEIYLYHNYKQTHLQMTNIAKIQHIVTELQNFGKIEQRVANMGLKIEYGTSREFFKTVAELIEAVEKIQTTNLYDLSIETSSWMFKSVVVNVKYLLEKEINKPLKLVKIARNINAFDGNFDRSDDNSVYTFWNNLYKKINELVKSLTPQEVSELTKVNQQKYFSLC